jgi:Ca-activated chloride channel family protein
MFKKALHPEFHSSPACRPGARRIRLLAAYACGIAIVAIAAVTAGSSARAQSLAGAAPQNPPTFRSNPTEVIVPVTATDSKGRFISDLVQSDFHIFDEGREQKIDYFSHEQAQPVVIGFLIDVSNRMKVEWKRYQESTSELMLNLLPGDKKYSGYLITYGNDAELVTDTRSDAEAMVRKLEKLKPAGGAALFDALYMACTSRKTVEGEPYEPRRVVIIIGDGHDSSSKKTLQEVQEIAQRNLVTIYAMDTTAFGFHTDDEDNLVALTAATGGRIEAPLGENVYKDVSGYLSNPQDAGNYAIQVGTGGYTAEVQKAIFLAVSNLIGEITTQYVMRYHPDLKSDCGPDQPKCDNSADKQFRHIKVTVGLPNVTLRFRDGYFPFPVPQ